MQSTNMMANRQLHHKHLFIVLVTLLVIVSKSSAHLDNLNKPCKFLDSINITGGVRNDDDGSITFEGIYYPSYLHATYDYEFVNETFRQEVAPHERGCTCKLAPCVRMCCPRGQYLYQSDCYTNDSVSDLTVNVRRDEEDSGVNENLFEIFHYVHGKPCHQINLLEPERYEDSDTWVLFRVSYFYFNKLCCQSVIFSLLFYFRMEVFCWAIHHSKC